MVTFEQVEKLREYANVSYDEARTALENAGGDILQAVIDLERQGKINTPEGDGKFVSDSIQKQDHHREEAKGKKAYSSGKDQSNDTFKQSMHKLWAFIAGIIHKGNINALVVEKNGEQLVKLPVTALVILLLCAFWIVVPLLVVGLFFSFRYYFAGPDLGSNTVNDALRTASTTAEEIKRDIQNK